MTRFRTWLPCALLFLPAIASARWMDNPKYADWAQRGRIIYLDGVEPTEQSVRRLEQMKEAGATPYVHAFTPHWPNDQALVDRLLAAGIPVDVRCEASNFFENDNIDRFAFIHGRFLPGGWWYNHAWRTNYDWYRLWPQSMLGTIRCRNGNELVEYEGHGVTVRRAGAPLSPEYRDVRRKQIAWLLAGTDPLPNVPMRPYENPEAKDPKNPYPMVGHYTGLWYDNPSSIPSYDIASRAAWEKHFQECCGEPLWDPPSHPDPIVRREWARFWADSWVDYFLWRKQYQDELVKKRGLLFAFASGNFSVLAQPQGTIWFYAAKHGIVDMLGPSEFDDNGFNRGRFHFPIKTALAATHGRPSGRFYPNDLNIAESLAVSGCNTYKPEAAAFLAANVDLYANTQPGGRIAVLFHTEQNLVESQLVNLQELIDQITALGFPYEVVTEDDLGADLAGEFPLVVVANTDFTPSQVAALKAYLGAGGHMLLVGDCLVGKQGTYPLGNPPPWMPDITVASRLPNSERLIVDPRQMVPTGALQDAIEKLGGPGFRLESADPDLLINILRQPRPDLMIVGLVNYSGTIKQNIRLRLTQDRKVNHAGWISRDGGAGMLDIRDGTITLPELRYGCTIILGSDRNVIERRVQKNAAQFPLVTTPAAPRLEASKYRGGWATRIATEAVPPSQTLCRHCVGASDRRGYLILDVLGPKQSNMGEAARFSIHILDAGYDYIEYWQWILENTRTGERAVAPIDLPDANAHGQREKLVGSTLIASWKPTKPGTYQAYLAYRVVSVNADGEPFLHPSAVPAGYSGTTPANLFLKGKPLQKRPCEDRLRCMRIVVK